MAAQSMQVSLWDGSAQPLQPLPPIDGDLDTEVAIVGAGFTGLSTALHLSELGIGAVVLEAEKVGFGGSGRNAGLVNPGMWLSPDEVVETLGKDLGERLNEGFRRGPAYVFELIDRHGIACEDVRNGTIYLASSAKTLAKIRSRAAQMNARGANVEVLDRDATAAKLGAEGFLGATLDHDAGTINPMGYARGLANAALKAGARIFCESRVTKLEREGDKWRVRTATGTVTAKRVLLATNGYTDGLWPGLRQEIFPFYFCLFATKPLGENLRNTILPERQAAWDAREPTIVFRFDGYGRLITGTIGAIPEDGTPTFRHRWADNRLRKFFPQLGDVTWEKTWMGQIAFTNDHLPRLHELAPDLFTVIGYNGRGIAPGTVMGRAMAHFFARSEDVELPLPLTPHRRLAFGGLRSRFYDVGAGMMQRMQMLRE